MLVLARVNGAKRDLLEAVKFGGDRDAKREAFNAAYEDAEKLSRELIAEKLPGSDRIAAEIADARNDVEVATTVLNEAEFLLEGGLKKIRDTKEAYIKAIKDSFIGEYYET